MILGLVSYLRLRLSKIHNSRFRTAFSKAASLFLYVPLVYIGRLLDRGGLGSYIPLYQAYRNSSARRIEQDVYARFFTSIEQRVARKDILELGDVFSRVIVSEHIPYWHFLCER